MTSCLPEPPVRCSAGCLAAMCQGQRVPDALQHLIIKWHKEGAPLPKIVALMHPEVKRTAIKAIIKR